MKNFCILLSFTGSLFLMNGDGVAQQANAATATVRVDAANKTFRIDGNIFGSNQLFFAPRDKTTDNPAYVDAAKQMGIRIIRWPGGNKANIYDWKNNLQINPGRRDSVSNIVTLADVIAFSKAINAELSITINFGTMTAQDAADLVEFLNGPASSEWGSKRAALGYPDPLDVIYFEIGNEQNQSHMWYFSWTAENPEKYFLGGDEERRGNVPPTPNDPYGKKGDVFTADGGANQTYILRFLPVKQVRVRLAADKQAAENGLFEEWFQVDDLSTQAAGAKVFALDSLHGQVRFGDGVHGAMPAAGNVFLIEYTTYGHEGFLHFARAMRRAPSSVPIKIGAATLPIIDGVVMDAPVDSMIAIIEQMDFRVAHKYGAAFPIDSTSYRRQMPFSRTEGKIQSDLQHFVDSLGVDKIIGIGVTEWNWHLNNQVWFLNRTMEGAVQTAEYFIRVLNRQPDLPIWYMEQFALSGGELALIRTSGNYSIAPMGYVFEGFKPWQSAYQVEDSVVSAVAFAYDTELPFVQSAACIAPGNDTLNIAISNNSALDTVATQLQIEHFQYDSVLVRRLEGESLLSSNDVDRKAITLEDSVIATSTLPAIAVAPHSVIFLQFYAHMVTSIADGAPSMPSGFTLQQNYPNPFNPSTTIRFSIPHRDRVTLKVYDILGRQMVTLVDDELPAGDHSVIFDANGLSSGVYFCQLQTRRRIASRKLVLLR